MPSIIIEGDTPVFPLLRNNNLDLKAKALDEQGNQSAFDGNVVWSITPPENAEVPLQVMLVAPILNPLNMKISIYAPPNCTLGLHTVTASVDSDLGSGINTITGQAIVQVVDVATQLVIFKDE